MLFSANQLPRSPDDTYAYYSRWILLEFLHTFDPRSGTGDPDLDSKLQTPEELSGLLNIALAGLKRLRANGWRFSYNKTVEDVEIMYKRNANPVVAFLMDECEEDPEAYIEKGVLQSQFRRYCEKHGIRPITVKRFSSLLIDQSVIPISDYRPHDPTGRGLPRCWLGVRFKDPSKASRESMILPNPSITAKGEENKESSKGKIGIEKIVDSLDAVDAQDAAQREHFKTKASEVAGPGQPAGEPQEQPSRGKPLSIIYRPRGPALEYAELAANLWTGCSHGCSYCYGPSAVHQTREEYRRPKLKKDALRRLEGDLAELQRQGNKELVLLSFAGDLYSPPDHNFGLSRQVLQLFRKYDQPFTVLTKAGTKACQDFDLYGHNDRYGATLTFFDPNKNREWEPGAALPADRIESLRQAHEKGIRTWASCEPVIEPAETLMVIEAVAPYVDFFAIGKWNHDARAASIDWAKFKSDAVTLLDRLGKPYRLKNDLLKAAGGGSPAGEPEQVPPEEEPPLPEAGPVESPPSGQEGGKLQPIKGGPLDYEKAASTEWVALIRFNTDYRSDLGGRMCEFSEGDETVAPLARAITWKSRGTAAILWVDVALPEVPA
jgi:DNA repair photolyase